MACNRIMKSHINPHNKSVLLFSVHACLFVYPRQKNKKIRRYKIAVILVNWKNESYCGGYVLDLQLRNKY